LRVVWATSKQRNKPLTTDTTAASTRKRKAASEQVVSETPPAKRLATPVSVATPSAMSSDDEDFMSDTMSDDEYDNDSMGMLG
jgi:hypothetical protein